MEIVHILHEIDNISTMVLKRVRGPLRGPWPESARDTKRPGRILWSVCAREITPLRPGAEKQSCSSRSIIVTAGQLTGQYHSTYEGGLLAYYLYPTFERGATDLHAACYNAGPLPHILQVECRDTSLNDEGLHEGILPPFCTCSPLNARPLLCMLPVWTLGYVSAWFTCLRLNRSKLPRTLCRFTTCTVQVNVNETVVGASVQSCISTVRF